MPYAFEKKTSNVLLKSNGNFLISFKTSDRVAVQGDEIIISAKINAYEDADSFRILFSEIDKAGSSPVIVGTTAQQIGIFLETNFFPDASTGGGGGAVGNATESTAGIARLLTTALAEEGLDDERISTILKVSQWFAKNWSSIIDDGDEITQELSARTSDGALKGFVSWNRYRTQIGNLASGSNQTITFDPNSVGLEILSESLGRFFFDALNAKIELTDYRAIKKGLEYDFTDYKDLTNNSLVPKGFLKQTQSPIYGTDCIDANALNGLGTGGLGATFAYAKREAGRFGILTISRGTTNTNRGRLALSSGNDTGNFVIGGKYGYFAFSEMRIPVLSNSTNRFLTAVWFNSANDGTDGANVIGFKAQDNINSGKIQAIVRKNSVTTVTIDTGITAIANTWYEMAIRINPAGDLVEFYVNGSKVGEATGTANIPNGTSQAMGLQAGLYGVLGTTNVDLDIDNLFFTTI